MGKTPRPSERDRGRENVGDAEIKRPGEMERFLEGERDRVCVCEKRGRARHRKRCLRVYVCVCVCACVSL